MVEPPVHIHTHTLCLLRGFYDTHGHDHTEPSPSSEMNAIRSTASTSRRASSRPCWTLAGPLKKTSAVPSASTLRSSTLPPIAITAGFNLSISLFTRLSIEPSEPASSSVSTCSTSPRFEKFSRRTRSIPICIVTVDDGQEPQAPSKMRYTFPVVGSTRSTETLPPSAIRYGRTSSSVESTFSLFNSMSCPVFCACLVSSAKGDTVWPSSVVETDALALVSVPLLSKPLPAPPLTSATSDSSSSSSLRTMLVEDLGGKSSKSSSSKSSSSSSSSSKSRAASIALRTANGPTASFTFTFHSSETVCMASLFADENDRILACAMTSAPLTLMCALIELTKSNEVPTNSQDSQPSWPRL
mmetsp:Transcript_16012/g.44336  ORF Transcript_16012/g.44336 Transcript_16012/m.44336 type:complete len:356 (+) Transcript_16012:1596-2663(+)